MKKVLLPGLKAMIIEMGSKAASEAIPVTLDWVSLRETKLALMKQAYLEQVRLLEARDAGAQRGRQVQAVDEETSGAGRGGKG